MDIFSSKNTDQEVRKYLESFSAVELIKEYSDRLPKSSKSKPNIIDRLLNERYNILMFQRIASNKD